MKKLLLPILLSVSAFSYAQYPSDFSLESLENNYIQSKQCESTCGSTLGLKINAIDWNKKTISFDVPLSASQLTIVELPFNAQSFNWNSFSLNGKSTHALSVVNNKIYVAVPKGVHNLSISATIKNDESKVALANDPKHFENNSGVKADLEKIGNNFFIAFENKKIPSEVKDLKAQETMKDIFDKPIYLINREIFLSEKWKVRTTITPLLQVPGNKVTSLNVQLLNGENPLNSELQVVDGKVQVSMSNTAFFWESNLSPTDKLILENKDKNNLENWTVYNENNWLYSYKGISPISSYGDNKYKTINSWSMWPNEKVVLELSLPTALKGQGTNVENLQIKTDWATDPIQYDASFSINTSMGGRYIVKFEDKATESINVVVNGVNVQEKIKDGQLPLDLLAGNNKIRVQFKTGESKIYHVAPSIKFETPVTNAIFKENLSGRWLLYASGGDVRPAVLLWGILCTLFIVAGILSKTTKTPLGFISWLLLLLGLSQTSLLSVLIAVGWLVGFSFRDKLLQSTKNGDSIDANKFNTVQTGLGLLTGVGLITLISMVGAGLLSKPEIFVSGLGSNANYLYWYIQSWDGVTKTPSTLTLPLSAYHGMMLVWAVWLAFSLMSWLKWMWREYSKGGYWMNEVKAEPSTEIKDNNDLFVEEKDE